MTKPLPSLPNPFLDSQVRSRPPLTGRSAARPALVVFLFCLVLGLAVVGWRAKRRADDAHARVAAEALARSAAVELQFSKVLSAAEVLGMLARQSGGTIPDFQKVAAELRAARPGLDSLALQPGGVVRDIVPRAGNERALGLNVLNNPTYRPGATAAIQRRGLTVTGPLTLYGGDPGIVARVPIFVRGRDGRDGFWGFVAASMRLSEALGRARVYDLARQGYCYNFFVPAGANGKAVAIASSGVLSARSAVQQPVRAQDLEFRLALEPRGGWVSKTRVALETLGVVVVSGLLCLLVNLLESRRATETALAEANQRLDRETAGRKQAQEDCRSAKDEAAAARAERDLARSALPSNTELESRLNASVRAAEEKAQARQAELEQASAALQQAEQSVSTLQERLAATAREENKAMAAVQARLDVAQATIADLEVRLEGATRLAAEASQAKVVQSEAAPLETGAQSGESNAAPSSSPPPADDVPAQVTIPEPEAPAPHMPEATPTEARPPEPQPPATRKPPRAVRRKKPRQQMDLFEAPPAADESLAGSAPEATAEAPAAAAPPVEPVALSVTAAPVGPELPDKPITDATDHLLAAPQTAPEPKEEKPRRSLPAPSPVNPAQLRKAVNLIMPLFTGQDPGAKDCLKANRATFRSAFAPEGYVEFEQSVKQGDFNAALEHLKKAAKKHGIPV